MSKRYFYHIFKRDHTKPFFTGQAGEYVLTFRTESQVADFLGIKKRNVITLVRGARKRHEDYIVKKSTKMHLIPLPNHGDKKVMFCDSCQEEKSLLFNHKMRNQRRLKDICVYFYWKCECGHIQEEKGIHPSFYEKGNRVSPETTKKQQESGRIAFEAAIQRNGRHGNFYHYNKMRAEKMGRPFIP